MSRIVKIFLALNLAAITALVFSYADLMVSPGKLIYDHRASETDCFVCHTVFLGAASDKCIACHKVADIGVLTTEGSPVVNKKTRVSFHQKLLNEDCVACHSDHLGVAKYRVFKEFSHELLDAPLREKCIDCHTRPIDPIHRQVPEKCSQCHSADAWIPATFEHNVLKKTELEKCVSCHKSKVPADKLHRQISDKCSQCHSVDKWKPATFEHEKFFAFDEDHDVKCVACHTTTDYTNYTCYECHEHSPGKIREEHEEEGIRDYENCTACHRNADEDDAERAWESLKRGTQYKFNRPYKKKDKKRKKKHDDDD